MWSHRGVQLQGVQCWLSTAGDPLKEVHNIGFTRRDPPDLVTSAISPGWVSIWGSQIGGSH